MFDLMTEQTAKLTVLLASSLELGLQKNSLNVEELSFPALAMKRS